MHRRSVLLVLLALAVLLVAAPAAEAGAKKKKKKYVVKEKVSLSAGEDLVVTVEGDLEPCVEWECYLYVTNPKKDPAKQAVVFVTIEDDGSYQLRSRSEELIEEEDSSSSKSDSEPSNAELASGTASGNLRKHYLNCTNCAQPGPAADASDEDGSETYVTPSGVELQVKEKPKDLCATIELAEYPTWEKSEDKKADDGNEKESAWQELPVLTYAQRKACHRRATPIKTYEANEFSDGDPLAIEDDEAESSEDDEADETEKSEEPKFVKSSLVLEAADGGRRLVIPSSILPSGDFDVSTNGYWGAHVGDQKIGSSSVTGVIRVER